MSIADKIPGMKSGSTVRNIIILVLYFFLFPLIIILLPLIMGILVARNYGGWADALSRLPGISTTGGWKSGLSAAAYLFGILLLIGAVTGGSDVENTDSALGDDTSNTSADTATSGSSDENEDAPSEPADSSSESEDEGADSDADTNDPPDSSDSDGADESTTETATDGDQPSDERTTDSTTSESDTEGESESSGEDAGSTQATDSESTAAESSSDAAETDEAETTDDSEPQSQSQSTASVPSEVSGGEAREATVTRVIDGDTMEVQFANGEEDTVRLIGVDTPETTLGNVNPDEYEGIPDTPAARDHLYNWGQEASQYATEELEGEEVRVVTDPEGDRRGSYGRLLAYLYVGEENFNRTLLEDGYARVYDSSFSLRDEFDSAESEARSNDVGLWDFEGDSSSSDADESTSDSDGGSDDEVDLPPVPADGDYDCGHFDTQEQAQYVLENTAGDPHRLDADGDGVACETLP